MHLVATDWRSAELQPQDRALCSFAEKLTLRPRQMKSVDLSVLRSHGLGERAIHDAAQVVGYFNYINRIANSLGVPPEDDIHPWEHGPPPAHAPPA